MRQFYIYMIQLVSRTFDIRLLQIPTNFTNVPFMTQSLHFRCCLVQRVIGPYFFDDENGQAVAVTSKRYTEMINEFIAPKLPPNYEYNLLFQQDGDRPIQH